MTPRPPSSTLFPYTTLFRSDTFDDREAEPQPACHLCTLIEPMELAEDLALLRLRNAEAEEARSEEHTSELQSHVNLVCRLLLEKKKKKKQKKKKIQI